MKKFTTLLSLLCAMTLAQDDDVLGGKFTDNRDGKKYKVVRIDDRVWMAENLRYVAAAPSSDEESEDDNSSVTVITDNNFTDPRDGRVYKYSIIENKAWMAENLNYEASGSVCYNNQAANCKTYGRLYNWAAAMTACPHGWHLPNTEEWEALAGITDSKQFKASKGWNSGGNGTDDYELAALPGGYRNQTGGFNGAGELGYWWTSADGGEFAYSWSISSISESISENRNDKSFSFSIRCVREEEAQPALKEEPKEEVGQGGSWCYNDKPANCKKLGMLYDWETAISRACPKGWHLPSDEEWEALVDFAGNSPGKKLKADNDIWRDYGYGSDDYGFTALPGGYSNTDGSFAKAGNGGYWWTATESGQSNAQVRYMDSEFDDVKKGSYGKLNAFSVRCVRKYKEPPKKKETVYSENDYRESAKYLDKGLETNKKMKDDGLKFGVRAGFNFYSVPSTCFGCQNESKDIGTGFGGGLAIKNFPLPLSIKNNVKIVSPGLELNFFYRNTLNMKMEGYEAHLTEFALSVPVMLKIENTNGNKFWNSIFGITGFQLDIPIVKSLTEKETKAFESSMNATRKFSKRASIDYGAFARVGYNITESIAIDISTFKGLTDFSKGEQPLMQIGFGLSYFF